MRRFELALDQGATHLCRTASPNQQADSNASNSLINTDDLGSIDNVNSWHLRRLATLQGCSTENRPYMGDAVSRPSRGRAGYGGEIAIECCGGWVDFSRDYVAIEGLVCTGSSASGQLSRAREFYDVTLFPSIALSTR